MKLKRPTTAMKTFAAALLALGLLLTAVPLHAKHKKNQGSNDDDSASPTPIPAANGAPLPAEAAPHVSPGDLPSVSLQPFLDMHLAKILAPLGDSAFEQQEVIASLKAGYADGLAVAPVGRKPAYQAAVRVCDLLSNAITERQNAVAAMRGATATHSSEIVQPKGGQKVGQAEAQSSDNFFLDGQRHAWTQRSDAIRQNVVGVYMREREIERQIFAAETALSKGDAPASVTITPPLVSSVVRSNP